MSNGCYMLFILPHLSGFEGISICQSPGSGFFHPTFGRFRSSSPRESCRGLLYGADKDAIFIEFPMNNLKKTLVKNLIKKSHKNVTVHTFTNNPARPIEHK